MEQRGNVHNFKCVFNRLAFAIGHSGNETSGIIESCESGRKQAFGKMIVAADEGAFQFVV